ncbi:hypothetical protein QR680_011579 [Steinernema hermaphroditum]|uniref:GTF3C1 extended winged-helix domain-containing protein n=1 Tax=Steinernema hermaphroditum TaxID=289476 RepID=A0AA39LZ69_9BILA|nr:hypothetical protein QR680_011579 [Steinernema hermaphroditum]
MSQTSSQTDRDEMDDTTDILETSEVVNRARLTYTDFDPKTWSPLHLYRSPNDIVAAAIRTSGSEGLGRQEIGALMGLNTNVKAGNRRVSHHISQVVKESPKHIGQYQKMEGKYRCIKYFWKSEEPQNFAKLYDDFRAIIGEECPFKMGDVIKFPNTHLSTLRISDISLNRLVFLLRSLETDRVIVTLNKCMKMVQQMEQSGGYRFQIDKKSLMKCLHALEKRGYCRVFETAVSEDQVVTQIKVICHRDIVAVDHPDVRLAIRTAIDSFHAEGRVFPHGQLRMLKKKDVKDEPTDPVAKESQLFSEASRLTENLHWSNMKIADRMLLFRLQLTDMNSRVALRPLIKEEPEDLMDTTDANDSVSSMVDVSEEDELVPDIPPEPEKKPDYRAVDDCGIQSKMVRCAIVHELLYHFAHSYEHFKHLPNVYERFPPAVSIDDCKQESSTVYIDEESPLRFIPPVPPFANAQQGWFMLQDFLNVLPLSVYVLIMRVPKECDGLHEYLSDPIKRHTLLGDLPQPMRLLLMKDKKFIKYLEHIILCLCSYGLMRQAPNPDPRRFNTAHSLVFFVSKYGVLRDTSTSSKGYATVSDPPEHYTSYVYDFKSLGDVQNYWHHLRAIALSTPLSFRIVKNDQGEDIHVHTNAETRNNYRKYAMGTFERTHIMGDTSQEYNLIEPIAPHDGCAGFTSDLFVHLKRHWDLNPRPGEYINWFINKWRNDAEMARKHVEQRVENLQPHWNSFIIALMPSDLDMVKRQKMANSTLIGTPTIRSLREDGHGRIKKQKPFAQRMPRNAQEKAKAKPNKGKRKLDEIDLLSENRRMFLRSRFSAKEKDMLILIRAVSFFLNPVYRFWLNPVVLRDIMHDLVPESRCKTVQSLMAAGVRELARPHRLDYMQRIVKILSTFEEMRVLRDQMFNNPMADPEEKRKFFLDAFLAANRLLFMENCELPPCTATEGEFEAVVARGCISLVTEPGSQDQIPARSRKGEDQSTIAQGLAFNVLMAMLLCQAHAAEFGTDIPTANMETLVEQLSGSSLTEILEKLRADGLISRNRPTEHTNLAVKSQATLSFYYRHFFNHKYHIDIVSQTIDSIRRLKAGVNVSDVDAAGLIAAISACFVNNQMELDLCVPENILSIFDAPDMDQMQGTKKLRYLENANLHLEKIAVLPSKPQSFPECLKISDVKNVTYPEHIPNKFLEDTAGANKRFDELLKTADDQKKDLYKKINQRVRDNFIVGVTLQEIQECVGGDKETTKECLEALIKSGVIFRAGIDRERYIDILYVSKWTVKNGDQAFYAYPWTLSNGESHPSTLRWISEGIFFSILGKPGVLLDDLIANYAFALQPSSLDKILLLLEQVGCITRHVETLSTMKMTSPFEQDVIMKETVYFVPTHDAVVRFAKCFEDVELAPSLTAGPSKFDMPFDMP